MKADKGQFDELLSRMIAKAPKKTAEIHESKKTQAKPKPSSPKSKRKK